MKTRLIFAHLKGDVEGGEGHLRFLRGWREANQTLKLDLLQDWIGRLTKLHQTILNEREDR